MTLKTLLGTLLLCIAATFSALAQKAPAGKAAAKPAPATAKAAAPKAAQTAAPAVKQSPAAAQVAAPAAVHPTKGTPQPAGQGKLSADDGSAISGRNGEATNAEATSPAIQQAEPSSAAPAQPE